MAEIKTWKPFSGKSSPDKLEPEMTPEYTQWKATPTPATRSALLHRVTPILDTALHSYGLGSGGSPVLRSQAKLMALKAMETYDPQRGSLRTHLLSQLRGLRRVSAGQQQIISVPERISLDRKHLVEMEDGLRDTLGRDPSDSEIADATGLSLKRLAHIRQVRPPVSEGSMASTDESGNPYLPASTIPGRQSNAWLNFVYYDLTPTDQLIMDYSLGLHGTPKVPVQEIARRLGLTAGAISQRTARIQKMLDEQEDRG